METIGGLWVHAVMTVNPKKCHESRVAEVQACLGTMQRAHYPLTKEYTLNHKNKVPKKSGRILH